MTDYIKDIRSKVGHEEIILNFAGGILVNNRNQILLQKRADLNYWGLPGGALEFGETAEKTCIREFQEETGLKVTVDNLLGISTNHIQHYPNGDTAQAIVVFFLVNSVSGVINDKNDETLSLDYFSANNLPEIFNQQHRHAIDCYFNHAYPYYE